MEVGQVLEALADPTRRAIVEAVRYRSRAVNDIASEFPVSRPAISQHLRVLEEARLLRSQRSGRQKFYGVDFYGMALLRNSPGIESRHARPRIQGFSCVEQSALDNVPLSGIEKRMMYVTETN